jgi:hypothetical protein
LGATVAQRRAGQLGRLLHQHGALHVGGGAQAEGEAVAPRPDEGVGQRLARHEEAAVLVAEIGQRQADIAEEAAGQQVDALAVQQFAGVADGVLRAAGVVAEHRLDPPPVDAPGGVGFLDRHDPGIAVGGEEGGLRGVAVDLADADRRVLGKGRGCQHGRARQQGGAAGKDGGHGALRLWYAAKQGRRRAASETRKG